MLWSGCFGRDSLLSADKKGKQRCDGYLKGGGYIVSWCVGHLVEIATPEAYDEAFKHWSYNTLPILPDDWKYVIKKDTKAQFKVLKDLMKDGDVT